MEDRLRKYGPSLFVTIVGVFCLWKYQMIESQILRQQSEISSHQAVLTQQVKINEDLRYERSKAIADAIVKQCMQDYSVDKKLIRFSTAIMKIPSMSPDVKNVMRTFTTDFTENQEGLQCRNPLPQRLRKK